MVFISNIGSAEVVASYLNGLSGGFPLTSLYVVLFGSFKVPLNQNMSLLLLMPCGDIFWGRLPLVFTAIYFIDRVILLWTGLCCVSSSTFFVLFKITGRSLGS